jgi:two-component system sensor histidine kinase ChvG
MSAEPLKLETPAEAGSRPSGILTRLRSLGRWLSLRASSSLTRRIVVLNLAGLFALLLGFLYLNQFRKGLIETRVESLFTQGEIIAGAVAASATVEPDTITIDPDRLLQMQAGETSGLGEETLPSLEFSINPERVAPLLGRLVSPTRTRARIYDSRATARRRPTRKSARFSDAPCRKWTTRSRASAGAWCGSTTAARPSFRWRCRSGGSRRCAARF